MSSIGAMCMVGSERLYLDTNVHRTLSTLQVLDNAFTKDIKATLHQFYQIIAVEKLYNKAKNFGLAILNK
jgi:hypothetical protein